MTIGDKIKGVDVLRALADGFGVRENKWSLFRVVDSELEFYGSRGRGVSSESLVYFIDGREFEVIA